MEQPSEISKGVSCVNAIYRLISEIKQVVISLGKRKKIFDPIINSSDETIRALHYVKYDIEHYFLQYENIFNNYKSSLEQIKEFANEIAKIENSFFYPYKRVKEKYERLLRDYDIWEKRLNPILIKVIMIKQEIQQKEFILKTVPNEKRCEYITNIEKIVHNLLVNPISDFGVPHIDSALLFDPPLANKKDGEPDRKPECEPDDPKHIPDEEMKDNYSQHLFTIINWAAPEMMTIDAKYTEDCEVFCYAMLLWELGYQTIPYRNKSKDEIVNHVTGRRRESQDFINSLNLLNIQRKYYNIIREGWCHEAEQRIKLDEILLRFSEIEADITKPKRKGSAHVPDQLNQHENQFTNNSNKKPVSVLNNIVKNALKNSNSEISNIPNKNYKNPETFNVLDNSSVISSISIKSSNPIINVSNNSSSPVFPNKSTSSVISDVTVSNNNSSQVISGFSNKISSPVFPNKSTSSVISDATVSNNNSSQVISSFSNKISSPVFPNKSTSSVISDVTVSNNNSSQAISSFSNKISSPVFPNKSTSSVISDIAVSNNNSSQTISSFSNKISSPVFPNKGSNSVIFGVHNESSSPVISKVPVIANATNGSSSPVVYNNSSIPSSFSNSQERISYSFAQHKSSVKPKENESNSGRLSYVPPNISSTPSEFPKVDNKSDYHQLNSHKPILPQLRLENIQGIQGWSEQDVFTNTPTTIISNQYETMLEQFETFNEIKESYETFNERKESSETFSERKESSDESDEIKLPEDDEEINQSYEETKTSESESDEFEPYDRKILETLSETPNPQNSLDVPSMIENKKLKYGLIINKQTVQMAVYPACDIESPEINWLSTRDFYAKLVLSSEHGESFSLENHIDTSTIDYLDWIPDADLHLNNKTLVNDVYLEIKCPKVEMIFDPEPIPSKKLMDAVKNALKDNNPYRELIKVFENFGHFLPKKIVLGHKIYSLSKNLKPSSVSRRSSRYEMTEEFTTIEDFSSEKYSNIINLWENHIKFQKVDSSSLISITGDPVKKNNIKEWAISCIKGDSNSWQVISWEDLCPLYEIFEEDLRQEVRMILSNDDNTISTGIKEKEDGTLFENADVRFRSKTNLGFVAVVETFSEDKLMNLQISWILVGIPAEIGIYSSHTRKISILGGGKKSFAAKTGGIDIQLNASNLQADAILVTSVTYPKLNLKQCFTAAVNNYLNGTINVNIISRKSNNNINDDDGHENTPELHWSILCFEDGTDGTNNNLRAIGQIICEKDLIDQNIYENDPIQNYENSITNELDLSYKKLDSVLVKHLVEELNSNKTITHLNLSDNDIGLEIGKSIVKALENHDTITHLNLKSTYLMSEVLINLLKMLKDNKTRLKELDLSHNGDKFSKRGKSIVDALAKNTTLVSLNLSHNTIDWALVKFTDLKNNKSLRNLDLSNCNINAKVVTELVKFLKLSKIPLKELNLSLNNLTFTSESLIANILNSNKTLTSLNLRSNKISASVESLEKERTSLTGKLSTNQSSTTKPSTSRSSSRLSMSKFSTSRPSRPSLTSMYSYDRVRSLSANNLSDALKANKTLKKLDMSSNYIRLEAGRNLLRSLHCNKYITELNLGDNDIISELGDQILQILNNTITSINLKSTRISSETVTSIANLLKANKIKLRILNLSHNDISDSAVVALIEALEENTYLEELNLSNIKGARRIGQELEKSLTKNRTLKILNLSDCNISTNVVEALKKSLQTNSTLIDLDLSYNGVSMNSFVDVLETNNTLTKLNLSYREFELDEARSLARALKNNNMITHLFLIETIFKPEIGLALVEALGVNKKLIELDLSKNCINPQIAKALVKALETNTSIRKIDLRSGQLDQETA
ncbi:6564_t:CDS:2, partial [Scutellospora calospora]